MIWQGVTIGTIGEWLNALSSLRGEEDARAFLAVARAEGVLDEEVGYLTGYLSWDDGVRVRRLLGVAHPVFGMGLERPSPELLLRIGEEVGKQDRGTT